MSPEDKALVDAARAAAGVAATEGPDDDYVLAGIRGFVSAFDFWYIRVVRGAVPKYRPLIIARINTFIRSWELEGLNAQQAAARLVEDYARRNFVTAGGWALEELAIATSTTMQKSAAEGMDAQRLDPVTNHYHLYVLKSGLVTRNSDIIKAIKSNGRRAEALLRQGRGTASVNLNYAILAGKTASTFQDGVARPSSAEFWSDALGLPEPRAHDLALAMAAEAGRLVTSDASVHIAALETLVESYIARPDEPTQVDWEFLKRRTMQVKSVWRAEDAERHQRAQQALASSGYVATPEPEDAEITAIAEAIDEELAGDQLDLEGLTEP